MITRLYRSKSDIENLSLLKTIPPEKSKPLDFKRVVVHKPWGYEYLMYENTFVSIWMLFLKKDYQTSMHCHPNKKTSLIVIDGEVICSFLEGFLILKEGDGVIIESSVFHKTRAVSSGGAIVMEIESPPNKSDLVRLIDAYGREGTGYEGESDMTKDTSKYEYVDFHNIEKQKRISVSLRHCNISLCTHNSKRSAYSSLKSEQGNLVYLLSGGIFDSKGKQILAAGDVMEVNDLRNTSHNIEDDAIIYLTIFHAQKKK